MEATDLLIVVLVVLGTLIWRQSGIYRNQFPPSSTFSRAIPRRGTPTSIPTSPCSTQADWRRAKAINLVAARQNPDHSAPHYNLGFALLKMERFDEAEKHFSRALDLDPRDKSTHQNMHEARRRQTRYKEAVKSYRAVLAHRPRLHAVP